MYGRVESHQNLLSIVAFHVFVKISNFFLLFSLNLIIIYYLYRFALLMFFFFSFKNFLFVYVLLRYDHFAISARFVLPRLYYVRKKNIIEKLLMLFFRSALSLLLICATVRYQL